MGSAIFCNAAVQMVIEIDRHKIFKFASIQSELGQQLYRQHGLDPIEIQTLMFVDGDRVLTKSDAVLEVLSRLDGGWQLLAGFRAMPQPVRDWAYSEFCPPAICPVWTARYLYGAHARIARAVHLPIVMLFPDPRS